MPTPARNTRTTIVPCLRYRDATAAIDWLCKAFGFEEQAVHPNPDGSIAHAQITFGNGMIMLGSAKPGDTGWGSLIRQPGETTPGDGATPVAHGPLGDGCSVHTRSELRKPLAA